MTEAQNKAIMALMKAIGDTIKESPEGVPSGVLYAGLMEYKISFERYKEIIETFKKLKLVEEKHYVLYWIGKR